MYLYDIQKPTVFIVITIYVVSAVVFFFQRKNALKCFSRTLSTEQRKAFDLNLNKFTSIDYILALIPIFNLLSAVLSIVQFTDMLDQIQSEFSRYCRLNYIPYG